MSHNEDENIDKVFNLSGKGISKLEEVFFSSYDGEEILDLSNNTIVFLPEWLKKYCKKKLIISNNGTAVRGLNIPGWAAGVPGIIIVAYGLKIKYLPKRFFDYQIKCEIDFTSEDYWMDRTQTGIVYFTEET